MRVKDVTQPQVMWGDAGRGQTVGLVRRDSRDRTVAIDADQLRWGPEAVRLVFTHFIKNHDGMKMLAIDVIAE